MKFTRSKDGIERANIFIPLRVDRETLAEFKRRSRGPSEPDGQTLHEYLYRTFWDGFHAESARIEGDKQLSEMYEE